MKHRVVSDIMWSRINMQRISKDGVKDAVWQTFSA